MLPNVNKIIVEIFETLKNDKIVVGRAKPHQI